MDYQEFKIEYNKLFKLMMKYTPDQAGAGIYAQELADLADKYPEYEDKLEDEMCNVGANGVLNV